MPEQIGQDYDSLTTDDFNEAQGNESKILNYTDGGVNSPALWHKVKGSIFREIRHKAQLVIDFNQSYTVANNSRVGIAYFDPRQKNVQVLDTKRARNYKELSFSEQRDSDRNEFTKLDLSDYEDMAVQFPNDSYVVVTFTSEDSGNTFDPSAMDLELDAYKGSMETLKKAQSQA